MSVKRRVHSAAFKGKVALEALKELKPINVLASQYEIQPNQISTWKKQLKESVSEIFSRKRGKAKEDTRKAEKRLYEEIGRLKMELDWLKKKSEPYSDPIDLIESNDNSISIQRQCDLLGISRSRYYYKPAVESELNLKLMRVIDEIYTDCPFYGSRRMVIELERRFFRVNRKRVQRLMRLMEIEAIYPKPKLSQRNSEHKVYPYLLRNILIDRPNQVWSTDITYIPMQDGFMYLTAVIDWYSRYILSWRISNTLDNDFCIEALNDALSQGLPDIFNTDQGVQFTSKKFTKRLTDVDVKISMDGKGRALDNIFVERFWRTVKYENIYLKDYRNGKELYHGLEEYFSFYNTQRPHQSLGYRVPEYIHYC